jgi:hypothetical protein
MNESKSTAEPEPVFVNTTVCAPLLSPEAEPKSWLNTGSPLVAVPFVVVWPSTEMVYVP